MHDYNLRHDVLDFLYSSTFVSLIRFFRNRRNAAPHTQSTPAPMIEVANPSLCTIASQLFPAAAPRFTKIRFQMREPMKVNEMNTGRFILDVPAGSEIRHLKTGTHLQNNTEYFPFF